MTKPNILIKKEFITLIQDNDFEHSKKLCEYQKFLTKKEVIILKKKINNLYQIGYYVTKEVQL